MARSRSSIALRRRDDIDGGRGAAGGMLSLSSRAGNEERGGEAGGGTMTTTKTMGAWARARAQARGARQDRSRRTMTGWMQSARSECVIFSSGKTEVIGQGTAPVLVPMTSVFFGLFSHTFKIKPTLDNTLVDITLSFVLLECHLLYLHE